MTLPPIRGDRPAPVGRRPHCLFCGAELRPSFRYYWKAPVNGVIVDMKPTHREFAGVYGIENVFHSQQCAIRWALARLESEGRTKL